MVESIFDDDGYEYSFSFDEANTTALLELIGGISDPEAALLKEFGGEDGCRRMRKLCDENGIKYSFWSYV